MKKWSGILMLSLVIWSTQSLSADSNPNDQNPVGLPQVLIDVVLIRPLGFALTVSGAAVLMGMSPIIGMAAIAEPHDAFSRASDVLVVWPARFTFTRPLGQTKFPSDVSLPKTVKSSGPSDNAPTPPAKPSAVSN